MKDNTRIRMFLSKEKSMNEQELIFDGTAKDFRENLAKNSSDEWNGFELGDRFNMEFIDEGESTVKRVRVGRRESTRGLDDSLEEVEYVVFLYDTEE